MGGSGQSVSQSRQSASRAIGGLGPKSNHQVSVRPSRLSMAQVFNQTSRINVKQNLLQNHMSHHVYFVNAVVSKTFLSNTGVRAPEHVRPPRLVFRSPVIHWTHARVVRSKSPVQSAYYCLPHSLPSGNGADTGASNLAGSLQGGDVSQTCVHRFGLNVPLCRLVG